MPDTTIARHRVVDSVHQGRRTISVESPTLSTIGIAVELLPDYSRDAAAPMVHSHPHVEMNYIASGTAVHLVDDESVPIGPGTLTIVHLDQSHDIITDGPVEIINVYLNPNVLHIPPIPKNLVQPIAHLLPLHANLRHTHNRLVHLRFGAAREQAVIERCLTGMLEEQTGHDEHYADVILDYFRIFLVGCARLMHHTNPLRPDEPRQFQPMAALRAYIDQHYTAEICLPDLARRIGYSPNYLCERFREYSGKSIIEYAHHKRVERAMFDLRTTDNKVLAIALDSGFQDISHFNRVFRRIVGYSPSQYRAAVVRR